jgi:hypothetical protein
VESAGLAHVQLRLFEGVIAVVGFPPFVGVASVWMNRIGRQLPSFREPSVCCCAFSQRVGLAVGDVELFDRQAVYLSCVHALKVEVALLVGGF